MFIQDLIAAVNEKLTPTERRIAELVLEDPTLLAFGTVSDLAERAETSRPSIVRFANKLGFDGYTELQKTIREGLSHQLNSPSHRIRHQDSSLAPIRSSIQGAIEAVFENIDAKRLKQLGNPIAKADHVWILTGETSKGGAMVLQSGLSMLRGNIHLVGEHSSGHVLSSADPDDVAVVFDFARYRRSSITGARTLAKQGIPIVAVTDGPLSPLASLTKNWCELKIPAVGPFDSSVTSVLAAELIVAQVAALLGSRAESHIDQLETMWQSMGTYLEYRPRMDRSEK
jgi:DNA-binding MurR/RpiR family transcriptional regulator